MSTAGYASPKYGVIKASSFATLHLKNTTLLDMPVGSYIKFNGHLHEVTAIDGNEVTHMWKPSELWLHWQQWGDQYE